MLVFRASCAPCRPASLRRNGWPGSLSTWGKGQLPTAPPDGLVRSLQRPNTSFDPLFSRFVCLEVFQGRSRSASEHRDFSKRSSDQYRGLRSFAATRLQSPRASQPASRRRYGPTLGVSSITFPSARATEAPPDRDGNQASVLADPCRAPLRRGGSWRDQPQLQPLALAWEVAATGALTSYLQADRGR